jgi:plastocyanin
MQLCSLLTMLAIGSVGCGGSSTTTPPTDDLAATAGGQDLANAGSKDLATAAGAMTASVNVGPGISFSPSSVTIARGGTVTWTWSGGIMHSVTSGTCSGTCTADGKFTSSTQAGGTFQFTFDTSGDFPYFCLVHGAMMTATVHVQ